MKKGKKTKVESKELAKIEKKVVMQNDMTPEGLIARAIDKGDVEMIEKLMSMRRELKAEKAKEDYILAMSNFQKERPIIKKTKKVYNKDLKTVRYMYAPIESIERQLRQKIQENNFCYTFDVLKVETDPQMVNVDLQPTEWVTVACKISHSAGHSETSTFRGKVNPSAFMSDDQKIASARTFWNRYAFCNGFGISTADIDDDAFQSSSSPAQKTENMREKIKDLPDFGETIKPVEKKVVTNPESADKKTDLQKQQEIWERIMETQGNDKSKTRTYIKKISAFTTKSGENVEGVDDLEKITGKWLNIVLHKVREGYKIWQEKQSKIDEDIPQEVE